MATLRQAIEANRERGILPRTPGVSVIDLHRRFQPSPRGSTRALIRKMFEAISAKKPWAIILCRFKGAMPHPSEPDVEALFRRMFAPGSGGLVEYWRDVSLGNIDITGSKIFDWIEVDISRHHAGGHPGSIPPGPGRLGLTNAAIRAVLAKDPHALDGFHSQISVYNENWSSDVVPIDQQFQGSPFWIDGSAAGIKVNLTPPHAADITAHEMAHGFGLQHDVNADATKYYDDPCCILSLRPLFARDGWTSMFGPAVCLPHLVQNGWMYQQRMFTDNGNWLAARAGITLRLAQISDPGANAHLGAKLAMSRGADQWDYYLEYARPTAWNRGLDDDYVFIRRIRPSKDGPTAAILGKIAVPTRGGTARFVEPTGQVLFEAWRADAGGRTVDVLAWRL